MAASKTRPTRSAPRKVFKSEKPTRLTKAVGSGQVAITGSAEKRLLPRNTPIPFPGSPMPATGMLGGSDSVVTSQRLYYFKLTQFNPIAELTPDRLVNYLQLFKQGYLRYFALLADAMMSRDDVLSTVIPKRQAAVKRLKWQILINEDISPGQLPEAEKHKQALMYFYSHLRCTSSVDLNLHAGIKTLLGQMMLAKCYKYSTHELIWLPSSEGLTARFNHIPIWFFENRTGKLRFLEIDYQLEGRDLKDGSFMTTVSDNLMETCAVAYMFKHLGLKWWLTYIEGHAMPIKVGKTKAAIGTTNYEKFKEVLSQLGVDTVVAINSEDDIDKIDISSAGELPYPILVDRMDRAMATLWRGADLSTISGKTQQGGQGALLQGKEEFNLQCDDAELLSETLNLQIDPLVIGWQFGEGTKPLAYFKLVVPPNIEAATDLEIFAYLQSVGVELGKEQVRSHFGVETMGQFDKPLDQPAVPIAGKGKAGAGSNGNPSRQLQDEMELADEAANEKSGVNKSLLEATRDALVRQQNQELKPVIEAVNEIISLPNESSLDAYRNFKKKVLPEILLRINRHPGGEKILYEAACSGLFNGLIHAEIKQKI